MTGFAGGVLTLSGLAGMAQELEASKRTRVAHAARGALVHLAMGLETERAQSGALPASSGQKAKAM